MTTKTLKICITLLLASSIPFATANDYTDHNEHHSTWIDPSADITALATLQSIKNTKPLTLTVPTINHFKTQNGIPVAFVRSTSLPIVDISLLFNAGSARDEDIRQGGFGIAKMTANMLTQGTNTLTENEFNQQVENLGIALNSNAYKDMFIISLRSLSDDQHLTPALNLMQQMLTNPKFDKTALERNKAQLQVALQQQQQDPAYIANLTFNQHLYGNHPYAHPSSGTADSVSNISQQDLQNFKQKFLVANNASLAITGNLTLQQAQQLANTLTAELPKGKPAPALPDPKPLTETQHIHIPFDSTQTTVIMGQLGAKRQSDDTTLQQQTNFAIANDILAGSNFNARLMTEIRQKRGYTYGIYGGTTPMLSRGAYQIYFSTRNEKVKDAIDDTLKVIDNTLQHGITQTELQLTKEGTKNSFPKSFASNAGINNLLGMMTFYKLPDSYLTNYLTRIDNITLNHANQALKQNLDPEHFLIVTVGQNPKEPQ